MPRFPREFQPLLAIAAATLDLNGVVMEANAGWLRLLGLEPSQAIGAAAATFFVQPNFPTLAHSNAAADGAVYHGLLTIGDPMGRTQSLYGRVWRVDGELRVLAEYDIDELGRLYDTLLDLNRDYASAQLQLAQTNIRLRQREAEILAISLTDPLTGVGNRRRLEQSLPIEIKRAERTGEKLSAFVADLDHFKRVNDGYGHEAGDKVLAEFGDSLRRLTRSTDILVRSGGEEFIVLMPHTDLNSAILVADRFRNSLAATWIEPLPDPVTVSVGVAELATGEPGYLLLRRADKALYEAKRLGRNKVIADLQPAEPSHARGEVVGSCASALAQKEDRANIDKKGEKASAGEPPRYSVPLRPLAMDERVVPASSPVSPVRGKGDASDFNVDVIDYNSGRSEVEATRRESEERFRLAMMGANDGLWDLRLDDHGVPKNVYFSPRYKAMLGYGEDEIENDVSVFSRLTDAGSYQAVRAQMDEIVSGARDRYELEIKMRHKDGRWLDILTRGLPVFDDQKRMVRLVGTHVDISGRKRQEADQRLATVVFASTHEGVVVTDRGGFIILVNPAFQAITGYEADELVGRHMRILRSDQHGREFYQAMWREIRETGVWRGEIWNRRKSGEICPQLLTISTVRDKDGAVTNYVGLFTDISKWKQSESKLDFLTHHDPLTGLPNRLLLRSRIEQAIRKKSNGAVLFLDIDRFKTVTDSLGHPVGDQLLVLVAERLKSCMRPSDTLARQCGDEFIVLLENIENARHVAAIAQRMLAQMGQSFVLACQREVFIGVSIGVSLFPQDGDTCPTLTQRADSALYLAKKSGGATVRFYSPVLTKTADDRLRIEAGLFRALERGEFELQYQPLVDLAEGRMTGVEALVRWRSASGLIAPMEFIPLAEETGLIIPLGEWVLRQACARMKAWRDAGRDIDFVAVNLSPRQFDKADLCDRVAAILAETGLDAKVLELEITESALMQLGNGAEAKLVLLKEIGLRIAIGDFGTGHSSLSYLKRFPIDKLKIDRSFISEIPGDPKGMEIIAAVVRLAHSLKMKALAEGVEVEGQADFLALCGCDMAQGYLFDKPLWEAELIERFDASQRAKDILIERLARSLTAKGQRPG